MVAKLISPWYFWLTFSSKSNELILFASLMFCFCFLKFSEYMGLSAEVGCFLSGVIISIDPKMCEKILNITEPLRDFFSAIFFASIGFHIFPSFLFHEGFNLIIFTGLVVIFKLFTSYFTFKNVFRVPKGESAFVSIGLGQISEFSFVVASKGRKRGIISKETYFLIIGTAALSLLATPLLFRICKLFRLPFLVNFSLSPKSDFLTNPSLMNHPIPGNTNGLFSEENFEKLS